MTNDRTVVRFALTRTEAIDLDACLPLLSPEERVRVEAFRHARARAEHLVGRALLRLALAPLLQLDAPEVPIALGSHGRPHCPLLPAPADFNVSHSHGLVLVAWATAALGVDVQRRDPALGHRSTVALVFAPEELAAFDAAAEPIVVSLRLWALKEAYLKALGHGLVEQPRSHPVLLDGTRAFAPKHPQLTFVEPALEADHHVAFAVASPEPVLERVPVELLAPTLLRR